MIDLDALRELLGDEDEAFLAELMRTYLTETEHLRLRLDRAAEEQDTEAVRSIAHRLKGASSALALPALTAAWAEVESAAQESNAPSHLPDLLDRVRHMQKRTTTEMKSLLAQMAS